MVECQFIKRKEHSKKPDQYLILNLLMKNLELEELELEEVIINSELSDSEKETSTGPLNQTPEKQEFLTSFIMLPTTSWLELKH